MRALAELETSKENFVHWSPPARIASFVRTSGSRSERRTLSVLKDSVPERGRGDFI